MYMMRKIFILWVVVLLMVASAAIGSAEVEWETLNTLKLDAPPLDVAISPDGKTVFVLTLEGNIHIYEVNGRLTGKIEVGENIDQIKLGPEGIRLFATSRQNKTVKVIALDFIKQISTKGSPYKGIEDAPVVIAGFSDFE
jgi:DNA-binding beta-propeller fold protein YncE